MVAVLPDWMVSKHTVSVLGTTLLNFLTTAVRIPFFSLISWQILARPSLPPVNVFFLIFYPLPKYVRNINFEDVISYFCSLLFSPLYYIATLTLTLWQPPPWKLAKARVDNLLCRLVHHLSSVINFLWFGFVLWLYSLSLIASVYTPAGPRKAESIISINYTSWLKGK